MTEDEKMMQKRTICCQHSGKYRPADPGNPRKSVKLDCPFHINLSRPTKQNPNSYVYVTKLVNQHNHEICPNALQFEKLKAFTEAMRILTKKYPHHPLFSKDLYAEIQRHRPSARFNEGDAARKLGSSFNNFYSTFWRCRNANTLELFYHYWEELFTKYPSANQYLQKQLYERRRSWARRFVTTLFTLGIESTSSEETQKQRQYEERIREIPSTNNILTIYPEIEILVDRYLEPNVARFIVVRCLPANNPSESENFEDEPDNIFM
ncbi:13444_t:CDS:2, partial [Gigaspora rosea]